MAFTNTKKTGKFEGKSNALGQGGRAAQLAAHGVPQAVIGAIARSKGAAPGQKNFHRSKKRKLRASDDPNKNDTDKYKQDVAAGVSSKTRKRKAKRPIEQQPQALSLEKEPDVVASPTGKKLTEGFRKRTAHRGATKKRGGFSVMKSMKTLPNKSAGPMKPMITKTVQSKGSQPFGFTPQNMLPSANAAGIAIRPNQAGGDNTTQAIPDKTADKITAAVPGGPKQRKRKAHRGATKKRGIVSAIANVGKNFTKNVGNAAAKASGWPGGINDLQLNKSGTVGTEPMSKGNSKFTEVKAGPAAIDIPMGTVKRKRAHRSMPQRRTHRTMTGMDMLNKATRR